MHDLIQDPDAISTFECLSCGHVLTAESRPGECPECGERGAFRNRANAPE